MMNDFVYNLEELKKSCREILSVKSPGTRTTKELEILQKYAKAVDLFPSVDDELDMSTLLQGMAFLRVPTNTLLFLQGQPGSHYFILFKGQIEIYKALDDNHRDQLLKKYKGKEMECLGNKFSRPYLGHLLASMPVNKGFGELALVREGATRACAAITSRDSDIIDINPALYKACLRQYHLHMVNIGDRFKFLITLPAFRGVRHKDTTDIAYKLKPVSFPRHKKIYEKGLPIEEILIISQGEVSLHDTREVVVDTQDPLTGEQIQGVKGQHEVEYEVVRVGVGGMIGALDWYIGHKHHPFSVRAVAAMAGFVMSLAEFHTLRLASPSLENFIEQEQERVRQRKRNHMAAGHLGDVLQEQIQTTVHNSTREHFIHHLGSSTNVAAFRKLNRSRTKTDFQLPTLISKDLRNVTKAPPKRRLTTSSCNLNSGANGNSEASSPAGSITRNGMLKNSGFSRTSSALSIALSASHGSRPHTAFGDSFFNFELDDSDDSEKGCPGGRPQTVPNPPHPSLDDMTIELPPPLQSTNSTLNSEVVDEDMQSLNSLKLNDSNSTRALSEGSMTSQPLLSPDSNNSDLRSPKPGTERSDETSGSHKLQRQGSFSSKDDKGLTKMFSPDSTGGSLKTSRSEQPFPTDHVRLILSSTSTLQPLEEKSQEVQCWDDGAKNDDGNCLGNLAHCESILTLQSTNTSFTRKTHHMMQGSFPAEGILNKPQFNSKTLEAKPFDDRVVSPLIFVKEKEKKHLPHKHSGGKFEQRPSPIEFSQRYGPHKSNNSLFESSREKLHKSPRVRKPRNHSSPSSMFLYPLKDQQAGHRKPAFSSLNSNPKKERPMTPVQRTQLLTNFPLLGTGSKSDPELFSTTSPSKYSILSRESHKENSNTSNQIPSPEKSDFGKKHKTEKIPIAVSHNPKFEKGPKNSSEVSDIPSLQDVVGRKDLILRRKSKLKFTSEEILNEVSAQMSTLSASKGFKIKSKFVDPESLPNW